MADNIVSLYNVDGSKFIGNQCTFCDGFIILYSSYCSVNIYFVMIHWRRKLVYCQRPQNSTEFCCPKTWYNITLPLLHPPWIFHSKISIIFCIYSKHALRQRAGFPNQRFNKTSRFRLLWVVTMPNCTNKSLPKQQSITLECSKVISNKRHKVTVTDIMIHLRWFICVTGSDQLQTWAGTLKKGINLVYMFWT